MYTFELQRKGYFKGLVPKSSLMIIILMVPLSFVSILDSRTTLFLSIVWNLYMAYANPVAFNNYSKIGGCGIATMFLSFFAYIIGNFCQSLMSGKDKNHHPPSFLSYLFSGYFGTLLCLRNYKHMVIYSGV